MATNFKDHFSKQADNYVRFRPHYPKELFDYLSSLVSNHDTAWDCGTGNGQAAFMLCDYFQKVFATDASEKQLKNALSHIKIKYILAPAEQSTLPTNSADLITVAQAFHWFDQNKFQQEVSRVGRRGAALALWCYELAQVTPEFDSVVFDFYKNTLGPYWEKERALVEQGYASVSMPFETIASPAFELSAHWTLEHFQNYLKTWSAYQKYSSINGADALEPFYDDLKKYWGANNQNQIRWKLALKTWRL